MTWSWFLGKAEAKDWIEPGAYGPGFPPAVTREEAFFVDFPVSSTPRRIRPWKLGREKALSVSPL